METADRHHKFEILAVNEDGESVYRWQFSRGEFDLRSKTLRSEKSTQTLDRSAALLLQYFLLHPNQIVSKQALIQFAWAGRVVTENSLFKAITRLRDALDDPHCELLQVEHGYGYRLVTEVRALVIASQVELDQHSLNNDSARRERSGQITQENFSVADSKSDSSNYATLDSIVHSRATSRFGFSQIQAFFVVRRVPVFATLAVLLIGLMQILPTKQKASVASTTATDRVTASSSTNTRASIAILPFVDLSSQQDQRHFADGLSNQLLDALSSLPQVDVAIHRDSSIGKVDSIEVKNIGSKLGVRAILEGSVQRSGDRIRVSVQLMDTKSGFQIWSKTYDRAFADLFVMQDDIARSIFDALRIQLLPEQLQAIQRHRTKSPEAMEQYLLAMSMFKDDETAHRRSIDALERALELDPNFVDARFRLADWLGFSGLYADTAEEALAGKVRAFKELNQILLLEPNHAGALYARGAYRYSHYWDWLGAIKDIDKAGKQTGKNTISYALNMARLSAALLQWDATLAYTAEIEKNPSDAFACTVRAYHLIALKRYQEASACLDSALLADPLDEHAHYYRGLIALLQAKSGDALLSFERSAHALRMTGLPMAYFSVGDQKSSDQYLRVLQDRYGHILPYQVATVHAWRGEPDLAFQWLQRAVELRDASIMYLAFDPMLNSIRSDPRFPALMQQVGLTEAIKKAGENGIFDQQI